MKKAKYLGIDGCRAGWFAVVLDEKEYETGIFKDILSPNFKPIVNYNSSNVRLFFKN